MKSINDVIEVLEQDLVEVGNQIAIAPSDNYVGREKIIIESAKKRYIESLIERLKNENPE